VLVLLSSVFCCLGASAGCFLLMYVRSLAVFLQPVFLGPVLLLKQLCSLIFV
jgi:hypothetical protein